MLSRWIRTWYGKVLRPLFNLLLQLGITANTLTIASLIIVTSAGISFAYGQRILAAWLLLLGALLDGIDGELARVGGHESSFGAFLDSVCDHCSDFAIYMGLLWIYLKSDSYLEVILIFVAMFSSVFGSHVRSRAGMMGIDTKTIGFFTRFERLIILIIGMFIGKVTIALWGLAVFNSLSAIQRVIHIVRASRIDKRTLRSRQPVKP
jgi:phosphatidylglycerophosphate synthase